MRTTTIRITLALFFLAATASFAAAQSADLYSDMHWREIGPTRAGRARAIAGVPSQPNVFYAGFDNGGLWRTTDYGSTWQPLFDDQPVSAIGAVAVYPANPSIIYVGSGAGIIRPDLATGDGMYKSTDAGRTWTHLGLRETQMIADVAIDPTNPDRVFVAALGHPYGPNPERGIFRSTDGGKTFTKVLYRDEYTSGNNVVIDPSNPKVVYATLWQQQQSFRESGEFAGAGDGIYKSTDGGDTWKPITTGLPSVIEANIAMAPGDPNVIYAFVAGMPEHPSRPTTTGIVGLFKTTDGGAQWQAVDVPESLLAKPTSHV
ncbi:MAG: glycoside hydrolase, partial [Gemmatimonadota bacterium]